MSKCLFAVTLATLIFGHAPLVIAQSSLQTAAQSHAQPVGLADMPRLPKGITTIFGGAIRDIDPVRDQFTLNVVGQRPMRVLFDERTKAFRDGTKFKLRDLRPEQHVSVETTLDGDKVFAVSIHILSQSAEGQYEGRVVSYNPSDGALTIDASASRAPFRVLVSSDTQFSRTGQRDFTSMTSGPNDLAPGSLVSIKFRPHGAGQAVASTVTVLAVPGSSFSFSGNVSTIDFHTGLMVLVDPLAQRSYQIIFHPALFPQSRNLHPGDHVLVTATYNGSGFVASSLAAN